MMMKDLEKPLTTKGLRPSWTYRGAKIEQKYRFSQLTDNQHLLKNHFTTPCDCYLFASRLLSIRLSIAIFSQADGGFIASHLPTRQAREQGFFAKPNAWGGACLQPQRTPNGHFIHCPSLYRPLGKKLFYMKHIDNKPLGVSHEAMSRRRPTPRPRHAKPHPHGDSPRGRGHVNTKSRPLHDAMVGTICQCRC